MKKIFAALPFLAISVACDNAAEDTGAPEPTVDERVDGLDERADSIEDRVYSLEVAATDFDLQATDLDLRVTSLEAEANIANDRLDDLEYGVVRTHVTSGCPRSTVDGFVVTDDMIILSVTSYISEGLVSPLGWSVSGEANPGEDNLFIAGCDFSDVSISYIVTR